MKNPSKLEDEAREITLLSYLKVGVKWTFQFSKYVIDLIIIGSMLHFFYHWFSPCNKKKVIPTINRSPGEMTDSLWWYISDFNNHLVHLNSPPPPPPLFYIHSTTCGLNQVPPYIFCFPVICFILMCITIRKKIYVTTSVSLWQKKRSIK